MDFEQRLGDLLRRDAATLPLRGPGPELVRRSARRRQVLQRVGFAAAFVGLAGGVGAGVYISTADDASDKTAFGAEPTLPPDRNPAEGGPPLADVEPAQNTGPVALIWRAVDGTVWQAPASAVGEDGSFYLLSTAPGLGGELNPNTLYTTTDGLGWTGGSIPEVYATDLATRSGVLYAIGTVAANDADGTGFAVSSSSTGERSWKTVELPTEDFVPPADAFDFPLVDSSIAVGSSGFVAVVQTTYQPDTDQILASYPEANAAVASEAGIELQRWPDVCDETDCAPAPVAVIPWAEVGVESLDDFTDRRVFSSADGVQWDEVEASGLEAVRVEDLAAVPSGFLASGTIGSGTDGAILHSADGRDWSKVADTTFTTAIGAAGERVLAIDAGDGLGVPPRLLVSEDGGQTWVATEIPVRADATSRWVLASSVGPLGAAVVAQSDLGGGAMATEVLFTTDGKTWTSDDVLALAGPDAWPDWVTVGVDNIFIGASLTGQDTPSGIPPTMTLIGTPS